VRSYQGSVGEVQLQPGRYKVQLTVTSEDADKGVDWYILTVVRAAEAPDAAGAVDDIAVPPPAAAPGRRGRGG
jgi:hypothetical protein